MSPELVTIILAILGSGTTTALVQFWLTRRNRQRIANGTYIEKMTAGAGEISDTALEQVREFRDANTELKREKAKLQEALAEAKKNYANALVAIARMQEEFRRAKSDLEKQYKICVKQLREMQEKYILVLEENRELRSKLDVRASSP